MTADDFNAFLSTMRWNDTEAMQKLGIGSRNTLANYRQNGGPDMVALACAAAAANLKPWTRTTVYGFKVWDQTAGDFLQGKTKRTLESINNIRGAQHIPGTGELVDPDEIDPEGRYFPPPDADQFYANRLLRVATSDEMPADQVPSFAKEVSLLHVTEGRGRREDLIKLFKRRMPTTATANRILQVLEAYA